MATICPHCRQRAICRTSKRVSDLSRELTYQCTNVECGHTFVALEEIVRTISPSAVPRAGITLRQTTQVRAASG